MGTDFQELLDLSYHPFLSSSASISHGIMQWHIRNENPSTIGL